MTRFDPAGLAAFHPKLPIVFAGNRKFAREWTLRYFHAIQSRREARPAAGVAEAAAAYEPETHIQAAFPDVPPPPLRSYLAVLRREGQLECRGRGRRSRWVKMTAE